MECAWVSEFNGCGAALFVPSALDMTGLVEITKIGDEFKSFLNPRTGKVHDCGEYHQRYQEMIDKED